MTTALMTNPLTAPHRQLTKQAREEGGGGGDSSQPAEVSPQRKPELNLSTFIETPTSPPPRLLLLLLLLLVVLVFSVSGSRCRSDGDNAGQHGSHRITWRHDGIATRREEEEEEATEPTWEAWPCQGGSGVGRRVEQGERRGGWKGSCQDPQAHPSCFAQHGRAAISA